MTIKIFRSSYLDNKRLCAQSRASPSMFSFRIPSLNISPKLFLARLHGSSAALYMICLRSLRRPGLFILPSCCHFSRVCPPFQAFVVNPRTSTLTAHLSSVLDRMSADNAATVMGLPLIEPELSISKVTTVSLKFTSVSILYDRGYNGWVTTLDSLPASRIPSSRSNFHDLFCLAKSFLWRRFASFETTPWRASSCLSSWALNLFNSSNSQSSWALTTSSNCVLKTLYEVGVSFSLDCFNEDGLPGISLSVSPTSPSSDVSTPSLSPNSVSSLSSPPLSLDSSPSADCWLSFSSSLSLLSSSLSLSSSSLEFESARLSSKLLITLFITEANSTWSFFMDDNFSKEFPILAVTQGRQTFKISLISDECVLPVSCSLISKCNTWDKALSLSSPGNGSLFFVKL